MPLRQSARTLSRGTETGVEAALPSFGHRSRLRAQMQQQQQQQDAVPVQLHPPYMMQSPEARLRRGAAGAHHVYHQLHPMQQPTIMIQQPSMMGMQQQASPLQPQSPWVGKVDVLGSGRMWNGAFIPMTSTCPGQGPIGTRKRAREIEIITKSTTDNIKLRRERNVLYAKRSRLRRKLLLESLKNQLIGLRRENTSLRQIVKQRCAQTAPEIFERCCTDLPPMLADVLRGTGEAQDAKDPAVINVNKQNLVLALQKAQQSFTVCSATSPGNTIVFASERFLKLTGYTLDQVVGRPLLFLKGVGTSHKDLEMVNRGIAEGRNTTACLLNYKADATAFWNQMFVATLFDAQNKPTYFMSVHCDIEERSLDDELKSVVKNTSVDIMQKFLFGR